MSEKKTFTLLLVFLMASVLLGATGLEAAATPRKMNGTWQSVVAVPENDVLGNEVTLYLPEFDTFSTSGTVITSSSAPILPLTFDQGSFVVNSQIGHGNWMFRGGEFYSTQWRFIFDATTAEPLGHMKLLVRWRLQNRNSGAGTYRVEVFDLSGAPYTSSGVPVFIEGTFDIWRLPVEILP